MILALTKIIKSCIRLYYSPKAWKRATIMSIPKPAKDLTKPDSYRQIALLSSIIKVNEKIILFELQKYLSQNIRPEQAAFRQDHSTTQQLINLISTISKNLKNRCHTSSVFIDVDKSFDLVWHDGLLYKISTMNIPTHIVQITKSFLFDRSFRVNPA